MHLLLWKCSPYQAGGEKIRKYRVHQTYTNCHGQLILGLTRGFTNHWPIFFSHIIQESAFWYDMNRGMILEYSQREQPTFNFFQKRRKPSRISAGRQGDFLQTTSGKELLTRLTQGPVQKKQITLNMDALFKRLCSLPLTGVLNIETHNVPLPMKKTRDGKGPGLLKLTDWITARIILGQRACDSGNASCVSWTLTLPRKSLKASWDGGTGLEFSNILS